MSQDFEPKTGTRSSAILLGAGLQSGLQGAPESSPTSLSFPGRAAFAYFDAGFSRWPPNWKRIAERSLFW